MDFLAVVSRPDFPSGTGPVGDYFNLRGLIERHPEWDATIVELNGRSTEIDWCDGTLMLRNGRTWFDLCDVRTALFMPVCLEIEETQVRVTSQTQPWPRFAAEQWRPISALFEARLDAMTGERTCLNRPSATRATNNKLMQFEILRAGGFQLPLTRVLQGFPTSGPLAEHTQLVAKNVSEGGWRSATEFSPARVIGRDDAAESWPTLWQRPIVGPLELRCYVIGDSVTAVALERDPDVLDVREANGGRPVGAIVPISDTWSENLLAMTKALGLDYAVVDAIPAGGELHVLEVNANGVWWFLPTDVVAVLEARFHAWIESTVHRR